MDRVEKKIDRMADKLDDHLDRISRAEEAIVYLKGHVNVSTTIVLSLITAVVAGYFKLM